ncbi:hypothetical protein SDC9_43681 [bioreactor metagenome]|uniref:Uncharacterized protein n=1 Tax=bioreactor metagenome TaxID=1076179 RepID=A0A644W227_9ZZZZ|nr:hypothetical protein [Desulfitobacterium hafniense]MEA5024865.1 hypothetical protein [Desulfitobacterium hafniense]
MHKRKPEAEKKDQPSRIACSIRADRAVQLSPEAQRGYVNERLEIGGKGASHDADGGR